MNKKLYRTNTPYTNNNNPHWNFHKSARIDS